MTTIPRLDEEVLRSLCSVVGDTNAGLTGSEIAKYFAVAGIIDLSPGITKRDRLFEALSVRQKKDACANNVFSFLQRVMNPVNYVKSPELFASRRKEINKVLLFAGYEVTENGTITSVAPVKNLTEAQQRADKLSNELHNRKVHPEVLRYCRPELLQQNYFHAVLEAVKGIASRVRSMTGAVSDGADLMEEAFKASAPLIIINSFITDTERSEQSGFLNLLKGIFGMFRNVTAHAAKVEWPVSEEDAYDLLTLVSLVHKKLDRSTTIGTAAHRP